MIEIDYYSEEWALRQAIKVANKSKCQSQRGVVIWNRDHGVLGVGFNHPPHPWICDGSDTCKANCAKTAIHAEQAAILNFAHNEIYDIALSDCEMLHVKVVNGEAVFSEKPSCWQCSKLILGSGIQSMWLYQKEGLVQYTAEDFHNKTLINCDLK